jgi:hypothetical protein
MHATNFSVRAGIYFVLAGVQLDMHNDYDFTGFSYDVPTRALLLTWQCGTGRWVTLDQPGVVILEIRKVVSLEVRPRSPVPRLSEDDCLNDVSYLADEEWGQTAFQAASEPDDAWRWSFGFMSGASIVVAAKSALLRLGPPS